MILHTSSLRGLANQSVLGDSAITGPNDILGHRVRRCRVQGDKSGTTMTATGSEGSVSWSCSSGGFIQDYYLPSACR